jgi:ribosomal protein S18 acetylase RimI-like enzyme
MRRLLAGVTNAPALPNGARLECWDARHAAAVHALLRHAYEERDVAPYQSWLDGLVGDAEFDAPSCFLALRDGELIGVALCWSSAFVKDLCVARGARCRGLGAALLQTVLAHFAARGAAAVELKVRLDNPVAQRLYQRLGFVRVAE